MLNDHRHIFSFLESYDPFHFRGMFLNADLIAGQAGQLALMIKGSEKKSTIQYTGHEELNAFH